MASSTEASATQVEMVATLLILLCYAIVALEFLFDDELILLRYLHFSYLGIFLLSASLIGYLIYKSIFVDKKYTVQLLWFFPAFFFISIKYLDPLLLHDTTRNEPPIQTAQIPADQQLLFTFISYSVNHRNREYEKVADLLRKNPADIICLQEIPYSRYSLFISAIKKAGINQYQHVYSRNKGLMILSKQNIIPNKTMPYLQATSSLKGRKIKIWNLHSPKSLTKKNYQGYYFDKLEKDIASDKTPHKLVCGDFNSTPQNDILPNLLKVASLQTAYHASDSLLNFSYPTAGGVISSPVPFIKIDYLLFTKNFIIQHYLRLQEYAHSDHYPIMATAYIQDQL